MYFILSILPIAAVFSMQSWQINEKVENRAVYGDMLLTPPQKLRYGHNAEQIRGVHKKDTESRWNNNEIPYSLSPQYSNQQKSIIKKSLASFEQISCFRFVERTSQRDYLFVVPRDGCYSYVGKIGGRQEMSLAPDCLANYIIWHEMMHAIGFEHEHQRPDRDNFIRVEYRNVQAGQMVNFEKISSREVDYPDTYDYKSIMHYDAFAFGKLEANRRLATMIPLRKGVSLFDNMEFSSVDIKKLNRLGKCQQRGQAKEEVAGDCEDFAPNCLELKSNGLCTHSFYTKTMMRQCKHTCGYCNLRAHEESLAAKESCQDTNPNCPDFATNGFCRSSFYTDENKLQCAKSCQLC